MLNPKHATSSTDFRQVYIHSKPTPHVVIDNFLDPSQVDSLYNEILAYAGSGKRSSDFVFARNKHEEPLFFEYGPSSRTLYDWLLSDDFRLLLQAVTDEQLIVDPSFTGGGVHAGGKGSYLDMHVDFEGHPSDPSLMRYLNILIYFNKDWLPAYGGCLDLMDKETRQTASIEPLFNRCVIMRTDSRSVHGYKPISFPDSTYRLSIAVYAYKVVEPWRAKSLRTSTLWHSESSFYRRVLSKFIHKLVPLKRFFLGSSTASRANTIPRGRT